ncbi:uncharacterized protein LOC105251607 isoform X2 [Camponotus floridanus]|uniref:uncharacterized protein LOC105251607 isoform X2 n=1 Tax=Camponotus floridanus TaxID=104421 RepID=UPI000DC688B9|nr:uncharacterized protein LOC105251607 isoform X2 [Camponotus floridanus]
MTSLMTLLMTFIDIMLTVAHVKSETGRKFWLPGTSSCICEDHFDASQWETVRVDGSRKLRRFAIPLRAENNKNVSKFVTMHDHKYTVDASQRLPFQDLTTQMNSSHDNNYISIQCVPSRSIQVAGSPVITRTNNITIENMHQDSSDNPDPLSILADICAVSEPVDILPATASSASIKKIQELQDQLKKQKEEIETLQHVNELLNIVAQKVTEKFHTIKSTYDKCRIRLWRLEQSKIKSTLTLTSRLRADQIASLRRQSNRGLKWSSETIKDALVFKMKWGTTNFSDFINYLPIFPSVRTLQRTIEHIKFESGILDEVFDMLKYAVEGMSENEKDCMIAADEMAIKAGLVFDPSTKRMIGKCTFPTHVGPANKILVIMCGGICIRWKVVHY